MVDRPTIVIDVARLPCRKPLVGLAIDRLGVQAPPDERGSAGNRAVLPQHKVLHGQLDLAHQPVDRVVQDRPGLPGEIPLVHVGRHVAENRGVAVVRLADLLEDQLGVALAQLVIVVQTDNALDLDLDALPGLVVQLLAMTGPRLGNLLLEPRMVVVVLGQLDPRVAVDRSNDLDNVVRRQLVNVVANHVPRGHVGHTVRRLRARLGGPVLVLQRAPLAAAQELGELDLVDGRGVVRVRVARKLGKRRLLAVARVDVVVAHVALVVDLRGEGNGPDEKFASGFYGKSCEVRNFLRTLPICIKTQNFTARDVRCNTNDGHTTCAWECARAGRRAGP